MKKWIGLRRGVALVLGSLLMFSLAACGDSGTEEIRFGTGGTAGTYYSYGSALAELTASDLPDVTFKVKTTAGSAANIRLLGEGFLQLAFAQNDTLNDAAQKIGIFAKPDSSATIGDSVGYGAVAALYTESCQVAVPANSGINSVADLRGKRVSVGEEESGVLKNADQILLAHGLNRRMLTPRYLPFSAAAEAMRDGKLDAMFVTAGAPTSAIENLAGEMELRILNINPAITANLVETYGYYTRCTIPAGTYPGQADAVETVGVKSVLVASETLSAETVEALTASLFDHAADLQYSAPGDTRPDLEFATEGVSIPFHAGAINYYALQGVTPASAESNAGGNAQ